MCKYHHFEDTLEPIMWEVEAEKSEVQSQHLLHNKFHVSPCLKKKA